MSLLERFEELEPRERQLVGVFAALLIGGVFALLPVFLIAQVHSRQSEVEELREAISNIEANRAKVEEAAIKRQALLDRYSRPAPPLSSFLAGLAKQSDIEIPEIQDADVKAHGKRYEERLTNIVLRRVSMYNFVKFLERIAQSPHPVSISRLLINKRGADEDSYDIQMTVSAFDRKAPAKKPPGEVVAPQ